MRKIWNKGDVYKRQVLYLTGEGLSLKSPGNKHGEGCRKNASNKNRSRRTKVDQCSEPGFSLEWLI